MPLNYESSWRVFSQPSDGAQRAAAIQGYASQLMKKDPHCRDRTFRYVRAVIDPAIRQRRIRFFFNEDGAPVGMAIWAFLIPDVSARVRKDCRFELHDSEWTEGNEAWIVDFICVPGHAKYIIRELRREFAHTVTLINYLRLRRNHAHAIFRAVSI